MSYKLVISLQEMSLSRLSQREFINMKKRLFADRRKCSVDEIEVVIVGQQPLWAVK